MLQIPECAKTSKCHHIIDQVQGYITPTDIQTKTYLLSPGDTGEDAAAEEDLRLDITCWTGREGGDDFSATRCGNKGSPLSTGDFNVL